MVMLSKTREAQQNMKDVVINVINTFIQCHSKAGMAIAPGAKVKGP